MKRTLTTAVLVLIVAGFAQTAPGADLFQGTTLPHSRVRIHPPATLEQMVRWNVPQEWRAWAQQEQTQRNDAARTLALRADQPTYNSVKPSGFDLLKVDTWVDVDLAQSNYLEVETHYEFTTVDNPVGTLSFLLTLDEVVSVESSTHEVTFTKTGSMLKVTLAQKLDLGQVGELTIRTKGAPSDLGDSMLPTVKLTGDIWYVTHSRFMPVKNDGADVFSGKMVIRVKGPNVENQGAGGTGTLTTVTLDATTGVKEFTFEHTDLTSLYAFAVSKYVRVFSDSLWNISVIVQPFYVQYAGVILGIMDDVVDTYSEWYYPYLWDKLDAVQMPNSFSGGFGPLSTVMCAQSTFAVDDGDNGAYSAAQLFSHEIGHQWWGNMVEMGDDGSIFLSESLAEFSSNLYFEKTYNSRWTFYSNSLSYIYTVDHDVEPAIISPFVYNSPYYYQIAYQKGACIADSLRTELGDDTVLAAMKLFMERYHENFAKVRDLFDVIEEVSGKSMSTFWDQWMLGQGIPKLFVVSSYDQEAQSLVIEVRQEPGTEFTLTLPIRAEMQNGALKEFQVPVEGPVTQIAFPVDQPVRRVVFDPRRKQMRKLVPLRAGDIDSNGVIDGRDLVELSFSYGTDIVYGEGGNNYFIPNASYDEISDLAGPDGPGDADGQINDLDYAVFLEKVGK